MIEYKKKILANGLTVVVNRDPVSKLAAVNILYKVRRAQRKSRTHGVRAPVRTPHVPRHAPTYPTSTCRCRWPAGDNNAFTNNDYTDFYITLPKDNVETALWLESDRMEGLDITPEKLETEKTRGDRGVPPALPQPALRRPDRCCCGRWPTRSTPTAGPPSG